MDSISQSRSRILTASVLALGLALMTTSCAQQGGQASKHKVGTYTVEPADQWAFAEEEDEMDILIPPYNPLVLAGEGSQIEAKFRGQDRKAAKISISDAPVEEFASLEEFIATLPSDDDMRNHDPAITKASTSRRVDEEKRNARVPAFVCAIKYEADQDWHVIGASDADCNGPTFFTFEIAGLPSKNAAAHDTLLAVRHQLDELLDHDLPGTGSYRKYQGSGPIPVVIQGSLFYDVDHAPGVVGPQTMKPETSWELHPVTEISAAQ